MITVWGRSVSFSCVVDLAIPLSSFVKGPCASAGTASSFGGVYRRGVGGKLVKESERCKDPSCRVEVLRVLQFHSFLLSSIRIPFDILFRSSCSMTSLLLTNKSRSLLEQVRVLTSVENQAPLYFSVCAI